MGDTAMNESSFGVRYRNSGFLIAKTILRTKFAHKLPQKKQTLIRHWNKTKIIHLPPVCKVKICAEMK